MAKLTLTNLTTINDTNTINSNNDAIEVAFENTLSRDGTAPNYMDAVLDMNDNRIINVPYPVDATDAVNKQYVDDEIAAIPVGGGGGGTSDHGSLGGLLDDDHPQYPNIASEELITGFWKYEQSFVVNFQGSEWWWWNGFYVEAYDPAYTVTWSMAEDIDGGATPPEVGFTVAAFSDTAAPEQYFQFTRSRGLSGTPAVLQAGDNMGTINWRTVRGTTTGTPPFNTIAGDNQARIYCEVDAARSAGGSANYEEVSMYFKLADGTSEKIFMRLQGGDGMVLYDGSGVAATGGAQGAGTINCKGIYVDGVAVSGGGGSVATLGDIGDVTISAVGTGEVLMRSGSLWINRTLAEAGIAAASHNHSATQITSGTMATARLGSGTANSTTFLRGDSTWAAPTFTPTFSGVRVYRSSSLLCTNNSYTAVPWSVENYDSDSYWSGGANITVPSDGYYHIDAGLRWDTATSGQRSIKIVANSVDVAEATVTPTGSINTHVAVSCDVYLTAAQVVTIYAGLFNGSGDRSLNISGQTTFCSIHKIA